MKNISKEIRNLEIPIMISGAVMLCSSIIAFCTAVLGMLVFMSVIVAYVKTGWAFLMVAGIATIVAAVSWKVNIHFLDRMESL